jgi:hypothetical protein
METRDSRLLIVDNDEQGKKGREWWVAKTSCLGVASRFGAVR